MKLSPQNFFPSKIADFVEAAQRGDITLMKELNKNGEIDVNFEGKDSATPMLWVISQTQNEKGIIELIELGANVNRISSDGSSPVSYCASLDDRLCNRILNILLKKGGDPNILDPISGTPALILAVGPDTFDNLKTLVKYGANLNELKDRHGETALIRSAILNQYQISLYLLEHGASFDDVTDTGITFQSLLNSANVDSSLKPIMTQIKNKIQR